MNLIGEQQIINDYKRLRAAGRGLVSKLYDAARPFQFDLVKAAKKLTLPMRGRTLIFESGETESAALMDFFLHEFRAGGRRPIDCCDPDRAGLSADERALLEAHKSSRTSLFEVIDVEPQIARLRLCDLLEPGTPDVMLSDLSMSFTEGLPGRVLLFIRLLTCQGIQMTSGAFFAFSTAHREWLVSAYSCRMKTVPPAERSQRTFVFFYQRHREFGEEQAFANPSPVSSPRSARTKAGSTSSAATGAE